MLPHDPCRPPRATTTWKGPPGTRMWGELHDSPRGNGRRSSAEDSRNQESHIRPGELCLSLEPALLCPQTLPRLLASWAKWQEGPCPRLAAPLPGRQRSPPVSPVTQDRPPPPEFTSVLCE